MKIAIVGAGGLGRAILDCFASIRDKVEVVFVDDHSSSRVNGADVLGRTNILLRQPEFLAEHKVIVAIGDCKLRGVLARLVVDSGGTLATIVHPTACVSETGTMIGDGAFIGPFALIGPNVKIGEYCIINNRATIAHDSVLGDGVNVSDGVSLLSEIGDEAFIGLHVCGKPRLKIGARAIIGAGSVLTRDVAADTTVAGVPARVIAKKGTHG